MTALESDNAFGMCLYIVDCILDNEAFKNVRSLFSSVSTRRSFLHTLFLFHERDDFAEVVHNGFEFRDGFRRKVLRLR